MRGGFANINAGALIQGTVFLLIAICIIGFVSDTQAKVVGGGMLAIVGIWRLYKGFQGERKE